MNRVEQVNSQFATSKPVVSAETHTFEGKSFPEVVDNHPQKGIKMDYHKTQGWGYKDSGFEIDRKYNAVRIKGSRYMFGGEILPQFLPWLQDRIGIDATKQEPIQDDIECHAPIVNIAFLEELGVQNISRRSFNKWERVMHSHGATYQEVFALRQGKIDRVADVVVYPFSTEQVETIIKLANKHNVVLVPYGGGTNVTQSLMLSVAEKRMIVSVDMSRMNAIKWVDKENNLACVQAGIQGQDLERDLKLFGVCTGHEPDSMEFSTLGGWINTRASGMKKNTYGNIEDIVQNITLCTSKGTYNKVSAWPRISNGPDLNQIIMGSEGNYGIVTECVLRVRPLPEVRIFDSIIFYDWESGIQFMHAVSKTKSWPTSIRLIDNAQFQFGTTLKPAHGKIQELIERAKKFYVLNIKGFEAEKLVACTLLFEGEKNECEAKHAAILELAKKFHGMAGGAENGIRGYLLTFMVAYTRDLAADYQVAAESFETSCPWANVSQLCSRVKKRIYDEGAKVGFGPDRMWASFRVTQIYETGAAVYVYFSMNHKGMDKKNVVALYEEVEDAARDEVMLAGGSISHHHGIGKIRKKFIDRTLPRMAIDWQKQIKDAIDPNNIFAINNTIPRSEAERESIKYQH